MRLIENSHPSARRHTWRLARQAPGLRRLEPQPALCLAGPARLHRRLHLFHSQRRRGGVNLVLNAPFTEWETTLIKIAWVFAAVLALSLPASGWAQGVSADGRAVSGTVIPGSGTTGGSKAVAPERSSAKPAPVAGSLSGPASVGRCAALRKRYAQSQSCYQHFGKRMVAFAPAPQNSASKSRIRR